MSRVASAETARQIVFDSRDEFVSGDGLPYLKFPDEPFASLSELRDGPVGDEAPEKFGAGFRSSSRHPVVEPLLEFPALLGPLCTDLDLKFYQVFSCESHSQSGMVLMKTLEQTPRNQRRVWSNSCAFV